jgi:hypothetical protein
MGSAALMRACLIGYAKSRVAVGHIENQLPAARVWTGMCDPRSPGERAAWPDARMAE